MEIAFEELFIQKGAVLYSILMLAIQETVFGIDVLSFPQGGQLY